MRYFFSRDNDSHWYLIPAEYRAEWSAFQDLDPDDEASWDAPAFAKRITGPEYFTFRDPRRHNDVS